MRNVLGASASSDRTRLSETAIRGAYLPAIPPRWHGAFTDSCQLWASWQTPTGLCKLTQQLVVYGMAAHSVPHSPDVSLVELALSGFG